ncbi:MAG: hypothetical protein GQ564_08395 [Bacteroidales bacterium]|nr:hypothetical protein [Bacteroidales bacterium]
MKKLSLISLIILTVFAFYSCEEDEEGSSINNSFKDSRDGKTYKTVTIGDQIWMAENLNYETDTGSWFYKDEQTNEEVYGRLYTWEAAIEACPTGWHLPTDDEWKELERFLEMSESNINGTSMTRGASVFISTHLKEVGTTHWQDSDYIDYMDNSTEFTALPGGFRYSHVEYTGMRLFGYFWTSTEENATSAWVRVLHYDNFGIWRKTENKNSAISVRCIKD